METENRKPMTEAQKESVLEKLWLMYFNDTLYEKKLITQEERDKMALKIKARAYRQSMER